MRYCSFLHLNVSPLLSAADALLLPASSPLTPLSLCHPTRLSMHSCISTYVCVRRECAPKECVFLLLCACSYADCW